ncbi:MAG: hypothetical protein LBV52_06235 [Spirochaetaceae bacterium]|nr:hypothetical protein [Spirochaetaceae bacterium]
MNQRLIIARHLANRFDDMPPVDGFPWHFGLIKRNIENNNRNTQDNSSLPRDTDH